MQMSLDDANETIKILLKKTSESEVTIKNLKQENEKLKAENNELMRQLSAKEDGIT